jgi:hypothetical protein
MLLTSIFYHVDNFCNDFDNNLTRRSIGSTKKRGPQGRLSLSEVMTIVIFFHHSRVRTFKDYYTIYIKNLVREAFPNAPSYNRFIEIMPQSLMPLYIFMEYCRLGAVTGISFVDSTSIKVCHNLRIRSNKIFKNIAARGKTSTGWVYGFKLHLIINECGEIIAFDITSGNCDDRNERTMDKLTKNLTGKLFGDKGYISAKLFKRLYSRGITLVTKIKKGMQNILFCFKDMLLLKKRGVIESVNDILKSYCQIEHSRHRSPVNFLVNLIAGLIAYSFREKKPSIKRRTSAVACTRCAA